jgi:hypothetical protein
VGRPLDGRRIVANKLLPGLADRYLARTGFDSQKTDEPVAADRPSKLHEPVDGLHAIHGDFGDRAIDVIAQTWLTERRPWLAGALAAGLAAAARLRR